jgi:endonuclease/exonuclease/phosphatase family metal-dependent hydrolase
MMTRQRLAHAWKACAKERLRQLKVTEQEYDELQEDIIALQSQALRLQSEAQAANNLADMQTEILRAALAWHQAIEELNGVQAAEDKLRALLREV